MNQLNLLSPSQLPCTSPELKPPNSNSDSTLFITKSRATHGAHRVTTSLIRATQQSGSDVRVLAWEHPSETARWDADQLWGGLADITEVITPETPVLTFDDEGDTFEFLDQLLQNDVKLQKYMQSLVPQFGRVVIDSWYVACSAYRAGVHKLDNVVQLTQSRPEFTPETPQKEWKSQLFSRLPSVESRRLFTCKSYMDEYDNPSSNRYIGVYVDRSFYSRLHTPKDDTCEGLDLVTVTSTPAIPEKGIRALLDNLSHATTEGVKVRKLTIMSSQPAPSWMRGFGYEIDFVHNPDREAQVDLLAQADVYVTCTQQETPGLSQLEALAVGLPSVAYDSGGNQDYYTGDNFIMADGPESFKDGLREMQDQWVRQTYADKAQATALYFTEQAMHERFEMALQELTA